MGTGAGWVNWTWQEKLARNAIELTKIQNTTSRMIRTERNGQSMVYVNNQPLSLVVLILLGLVASNG